MKLTHCLLVTDALITGRLTTGALAAAILAACTASAPFPSGGVLFSDDFSDPGSGWNRQSDADLVADYVDGEYRLLLRSPDSTASANPKRTFGDVIVDVDARTAGGPLNNDFGVQCRREDDQTFYFLIISADGYYGIGKMIRGEPGLLTGRDMLPGEAVAQGYQPNHIQARCIGQTLTLIVNGQQLAEVTDGDLTEGDVGLSAGSYQESGVDVRFDNLTVTQP